MPSPVTPARVVSVRDGAARERDDVLATEEPLEIRVEGPDQPPVQIAVTMRTPGHDDELSVGFLFTEGLIKSRSDVAARPVRELVTDHGNVVTVRLTRSFDAERLKRNFYATSSCGICGKAALDQI